MPLTYVISIEY